MVGADQRWGFRLATSPLPTPTGLQEDRHLVLVPPVASTDNMVTESGLLPPDGGDICRFPSGYSDTSSYGCIAWLLLGVVKSMIPAWLTDTMVMGSHYCWVRMKLPASPSVFSDTTLVGMGELGQLCFCNWSKTIIDVYHYLHSPFHVSLAWKWNFYWSGYFT